MDQLSINTNWQSANRKLVAKLISELAYEQAFVLDETSQGYQLTFENDVVYRFQGKKNIWGQVVIDPSSINRLQSLQQTNIHATQFMLDAQKQLNMTHTALAEHFEDLNATLVSDDILAKRKQSISVSSLANMDCLLQQSYFDGHPKFVFNKGRRGWGIDDIQQYAPESNTPFQLHWLAVSNKQINKAVQADLSWNELVLSALSQEEFTSIENALSNLGESTSTYTILPVHPWQWQKKISLLFAREIAENQLIYCGPLGDYFLPQLSIRTLSNITRPESYDIKLPLTIMNTSCYRGIPERYILAGPEASHWINTTFENDDVLVAARAEVLQEPASAHLCQVDYHELDGAPYRYHELLGVIWRESMQTKLQSQEQAILMAALMESDASGKPLIGQYVQDSGLDITAWLERLFDAVVIPYYHLLCKYGVSLIAHGQNVTLILQDSIPQRILLKDFQGDMRLVERDLCELNTLPERVKAATVRLPEELIIHDLQTGHFVTVLRFISPLVEQLGLPEIAFYRILGDRIKHYMGQHPELSERFQRLDLFKHKILRIGLNLAKFSHSTDNSSSRMLPDLDHLIENPLHIAQPQLAKADHSNTELAAN
ncbi:IucA/IucC family siderophore biosynthesis protein [Vibrio sp. S4M6]|uniref:IucA/IucC family protein n=1 Tax=Vibrio sinus TaxID=2946865 RepID=UPI00202AA787|nr:IucA/IucC family siderophore biosynthesis protein [Vibrio sinus]MCL9780398.1 IucA/IucC family siderophore biosynthesis protein [Vibrio sinus]